MSDSVALGLSLGLARMAFTADLDWAGLRVPGLGFGLIQSKSALGLEKKRRKG